MLLTPSAGERLANRRMPPERTAGSLAGMKRRANIYALDKAVSWLAIKLPRRFSPAKQAQKIYQS
jgi:hypothetical protein